MRAAFAVGAADDEISSDEAQTINQIASELGIDRPTLNALREAYVDKFSAIRARAPPGARLSAGAGQASDTWAMPAPSRRWTSASRSAS